MIVSLALIGILLVALSTFMVGGFGIIHRQGENTNLLYAAQKELDKTIDNPNYEVKDDRLSIIRQPATVKINGTYVDGILIEVKAVNEPKVILSTFITN